MRTLFFVFAALLLFSCKKEKEESSNTLTYTLDGGKQRSTTLMPMPRTSIWTDPPNVYFETSGQARHGHMSQVSLDLVGVNMEKEPLPFRTNRFFLYIQDNQETPQNPQVLYYNFDNRDINFPYFRNGNLQLTITHRNGHRIQGTINGTIFRSDNGPISTPSTLQLSFDVDLKR